MTAVKITYPADVLISFHYFRDDRNVAALADTGQFRIIGDSGAYSAMSIGTPIDIGEYAAWVQRWHPHLLWCASLDVIGDPDGTLKNWRTLRDRYGLTVVPTLHAGSPIERLDTFAAEGATLVGLGGMAGKGQAVRAFRWAVAAFRYARDRHPDMRFHLWGVTHRQFLNVLPAWSADSSGILSKAARFGSLRLFDPATGATPTLQLSARSRDPLKHADLLRRVYGVDPADIRTSHAGNRRLLFQASAAVGQQYAAWLQRRHNVSPPALLADIGVVGPRLHAAESTLKDLLATLRDVEPSA